MTCPLCGGSEKRDRCCWPMPETPILYVKDEDDFDHYAEESLRMAVMGVE